MEKMHSDISHSLIRTFEVNLEYTFARSNKYSSELDISHSLIRIFEVNLEYILHSL